MLQTESKRESNQRRADTNTSSLSYNKSECGSLSLDFQPGTGTMFQQRYLQNLREK